MVFAVRPVPRLTVGRLSPISLAWSPRLVVSPSPRSPKSFFPQHFTELSSRIAQVKWPPVATCWTVRPVPSCTYGRLVPIWLAAPPRSLVSPSPSSPKLLPPQHLRLPGVRKPHEWPQRVENPATASSQSPPVQTPLRQSEPWAHEYPFASPPPPHDAPPSAWAWAVVWRQTFVMLHLLVSKVTVPSTPTQASVPFESAGSCAQLAVEVTIGAA